MAKTYRAVCAGTYDPPHFGHMHTWKTAADMFGHDQVCVLVATNRNKVPVFGIDSRVRMVKAMMSRTLDLAVGIVHADELTIDVAHRIGARFLVRGVRGAKDFEEEAALADINMRLRLDSAPETIMVPCGEGLHTLSSSLIRELGHIKPPGWRGMLLEFTCPEVADAFEGRSL
jgi:pantetheine-phosphate adenylyltransferase